MTTPKRNEAVAPVAWVERTSEGYTRMWSGDLSLWANRPADPEPLYSQQTITALQGEVSRLREALELVLGGIASGAIKCKPLMTRVNGDYVTGSVAEKITEALNLEPPTDGR